MSKIKNGGLDQYGAEPFEQQQFGTAGIEMVNYRLHHILCSAMQHLLEQPRFSLIWQEVFWLPNFWNSLPVEISFSATFNTFKRRIISYLYE